MIMSSKFQFFLHMLLSPSSSDRRSLKDLFVQLVIEKTCNYHENQLQKKRRESARLYDDQTASDHPQHEPAIHAHHHQQAPPNKITDFQSQFAAYSQPVPPQPLSHGLPFVGDLFTRPIEKTSRKRPCSSHNVAQDAAAKRVCSTNESTSETDSDASESSSESSGVDELMVKLRVDRLALTRLRNTGKVTAEPRRASHQDQPDIGLGVKFTPFNQIQVQPAQQPTPAPSAQPAALGLQPLKPRPCPPPYLQNFQFLGDRPGFPGILQPANPLPRLQPRGPPPPGRFQPDAPLPAISHQNPYMRGMPSPGFGFQGFHTFGPPPKQKIPKHQFPGAPDPGRPIMPTQQHKASAPNGGPHAVQPPTVQLHAVQPPATQPHVHTYAVQPHAVQPPRIGSQAAPVDLSVSRRSSRIDTPTSLADEILGDLSQCYSAKRILERYPNMDRVQLENLKHTLMEFPESRDDLAKMRRYVDASASTSPNLNQADAPQSPSASTDRKSSTSRPDSLSAPLTPQTKSEEIESKMAVVRRSLANILVEINWNRDLDYSDHMEMQDVASVQRFFDIIDEQRPDELGKDWIKEVRVKSKSALEGGSISSRIVRDETRGRAAIKHIIRKLKSQSPDADIELLFSIVWGSSPAT
jgi:hypothetical protein